MKIIVKNRKLLVFIVLLISSAVSKGQIYKYIGLEDGLNNQKIYHIQKDRRGYMWFLTQEGVDRYDGKHIKHYTFSDDSMKLDSRIALNWLYMDQEDVLWVIGQKGRIFRYDSQHDKFELAYVHPELIRNKFQAFLDYGYLDKNDHIWLCYKDTITWYNIRTGTTQHMPKPVDGAISTIEQADGGHFFIGTGSGLFCVGIEKGELKQIPDEVVKSIVTPVHELYYHTVSKQLFVGSYKEGILIYDIGKTQKITPCYAPNNVEVNQIVALNADELLIATGGKGVYKLNVNTCKSEPYITADYSSYNGMNGNNINDIYVDEEERIWLANYPTGITIRNNRYGRYDLIKHSLGNNRSLVNDQVHDVIEDSDGDLWFATSNGISFYQTDTREWCSFFSSFDPVPDDENHIFLALCEVSPGVIWAGGFTSGIYKIEKKKGFKISYLSPAAIAGIRPDQYIYDIKKDSSGDVWSGGYYHLKRINLETKNVRLYPGVSSITTILEKNARQMWIGTRMGLYQLDKQSGVYRYIDLPVESPYICALYQREDGILYIGTRGAGLLVYDINKKKFIHQYRTDNCALISDNIYTIIPRQDENLLMGTENGITIYSPKDHFFRNWTREQGLMSVNFNAGSATTYSNSTLVFGGNDGAVKFPTDIEIPEPYYSRLLLRDFMIAYHPVYPGDDGSPLKKDINETDCLELAYGQNTFSLDVVKRIDEMADAVAASPARKVMIDHHLYPEEFCNITMSYPKISSTSELIFRLICRMGYFSDISKEGAECIYTGMMTDTGGFTYNSNNREIYFIISELLSKGIDKDDIYRKVYNTYSESRLRLMGYVLSNMVVYSDYNAALISLTKEEQSKFDYIKGDSEGFVNIPLTIKNVCFSCFLREDTEKPMIKISLRSVGTFPCNQLAAEFFNGGGHLNASGGEFFGTIEEAKAVFEQALEKYKPLLTAKS